LKSKIIYTYPTYGSFVRNDIALLSKYYEVRTFAFDPPKKILTPFYFFRQFFFLLFNIKSTSILICQFAGYHSFLPNLFAIITKKASLNVLGGTECVSFPSINYGNFNKFLLGFFTKWSLKMVKHIAPVHESLVISDYTYTTDDYPQQGYKHFCPSIKAPHTTICYGYSSTQFYKSKDKKSNSFITVAYLNAPNYYRKGIDLIFEMALRFPESTFTIIGNNSQMKYTSIPTNVCLISSVPYEELKDYYSSHEFYFQLSICEGFPSAICEAMLCECIPIGSNVAAIPEIIGDAGYVLYKKDVNDLEQLINKALASEKKELGIKARNRIITKYPPQEREKLSALVAELIDNKNSL
jgi:glycosyltransferase involved in cell wall biosynthesis